MLLSNLQGGQWTSVQKNATFKRNTTPISQEEVPRFGHLHHDDHEEPPKSGAKKDKKPFKLILWGLADVLLLGGSVFTADILVPDPPPRTAPQVQVSPPDANKPQPEPPTPDSSTTSEPISRALKISGLATGIHLLSHIGLAGGWFMYGRHRGGRRRDSDNEQFEDFKKYAEKLAAEGKQFQCVPTENGEFKIVKVSKVPTPPAKPAEAEKDEACQEYSKPES